jgi:hypothetical protein
VARSTDFRAVRKRHTGLVAGDLQPALKLGVNSCAEAIARAEVLRLLEPSEIT